MDARDICVMPKRQGKIVQKEMMHNFLKIIDDYYVCFDGEIYDLHKPADIRSLMRCLNQMHGFSDSVVESNGNIQFI